MGPHVGFQQGKAIGRMGGGPSDGLLQSLGALQPAHDRERVAGVRVAAVGAHDHPVGRKTDALQPGAGISASRDHGVAEVGGCSRELLADHQVAAAIHEGHPFDRQGQEGDGGVGPEAALAGQAEARTGGIQSGLGLEAAGGGSIGGTGPLSCKRAEVVRVDLIGHHQLQTEALAKGPRHGALLAMAAGQQHEGAWVWSDARSRATSHGQRLQKSQKLGRVR